VSTQTPEVARVGEIISDQLARLATLFKPGVKLTFLARSPDAPDGARDMVVTDDTLDAAIAALTIRRDADAR
jgi:hypothetical protein